MTKSNRELSGPSAGGHDHPDAGTGSHDRAHQGAAAQIPQCRARRYRLGRLGDRSRLAGQDRLVALQVLHRQHSDVGGYYHAQV